MRIIIFLFASILALTLIAWEVCAPTNEDVVRVVDDSQEVWEVFVEEASIEIQEECLGFCPDTDYRSEMIAACMAGDIENGIAAAQAYNMKNEWLGLTIPEIDFNDLFLTAKIIAHEAGSFWLSDEHQKLVASVLINRVNSPEFPDTIYECVFQPRQYGGVRGQRFANLLPDERTVINALYILENGSIAPPSVVFQAEFRQGSGIYKTIPDKYLDTTYFCFSSRPELYK
jgi:hypothetical protein